MMKKRTAILILVATLLCTMLGTAALTGAGIYAYITAKGYILSPGNQQQGQAYARLDELKSIYNAGALHPVDEDTFNTGAAKGLVAMTGDAYAAYFTPDEWAEFNQQEEGRYAGIGASVNTDPADGLVTIVHVYKGSPAAQAGLLSGDKILAVDGQSVIGYDVYDVVDLVRGEPGEPLTLRVMRAEEEFTLTLERAEVIAERVEYHMLDSEVGYIKIIEFQGNAATIFKQAVGEMQAQGMQALVLDLRNNPGGSYDVVVSIADVLFPQGQIIAMEDRDGNRTGIAMSDAKYLGIPMTVLINGYSASASELLCGGVQDYGVGKLVGTTTYGKGVAQNFHVFEDGSALRYTTHRYVTGGGRCPQDTGFAPDIEVELVEEVQLNPLLLCTEKDNQYMTAWNEVKQMLRDTR